MEPLVANLKTVQDCKNLAQNALALGKPEIAEQCRKRGVQIRAEAYGAESDVQRECIEAVYAYEEVLGVKKGRHQRASRTWPMIKELGIIPAVERIVALRKPSAGFVTLEEMGLKEFAFEAVILRHPMHFSVEAVRISEARMKVA
ncbi:hypothetical protein RD110_15650 [Rhodoferax koreense]|uniref:Uncharacterized protein n=1 Tax=Rhodoferax koreensis TaxID=1842727 RepID=A0A1P8JXH3_9BURK|nr:hypothetical protein [Rhodoferax koreense]APW38457.1 hypothetical protein RD110_15650 [Rhodoferax koreense]